MRLPLPLPLDDDLAAVAARLRRSTVEIRTAHDGRATGHGSGIVWDAAGLIVTNAHVAHTRQATVTLADGRTVDAHLVARDPQRDLATLHVDAPDLTAAAIGDAAALRPGHVVLAHGHPLGVTHSLTVGVVHATGGASSVHHPGAAPAVIAADIRLAPGNSGGPLANAAGEVVGINSMVVNGLGIAIPSTTVARFLAAQRPRPRLGATLRPVTVALRGPPRTLATGLLVLELTPGSPAARAGVLPGDVLLGAAGRPFRDADDLLTLLLDAGAGTTIRLDVGRAGRRTPIAIALGPAEAADRPRRAA